MVVKGLDTRITAANKNTALHASSLLILGVLVFRGFFSSGIILKHTVFNN